MTTEEQSLQLMKLKAVMPSAIVFTAIPSSLRTSTVDEEHGSDTDTADEDDDLPLTIPALIDSLDTRDYDCVLKSLLFFSPTDRQLSNLTERTVNQSKSPMWVAHRLGRLIASIASTVIAFDGLHIPKSTVDAVVSGSSLYSNEAMIWGLEHEKEALSIASAMFVSEHDGAKIYHSGLHICKDLFILGATPDGLTECNCCGYGIIEIKCSFKYRMSDREDLLIAALTDHNFCLNSDLSLKQSHKYYTQVQCQWELRGESDASLYFTQLKLWCAK
jgi:hypothetical protein